MKGLPAPPSQQNKKPLHSLLSVATVFLFLTVFPFISSNQSKKKFSFLTFTFVSYAVKSSYYIHIFLATHIRDAIEIIISYCLECRNIIEIYLQLLLKTVDGETVHLIAPLFLASLRSLPYQQRTFLGPHQSEHPSPPLAPYYQGKA